MFNFDFVCILEFSSKTSVIRKRGTLSFLFLELFSYHFLAVDTLYQIWMFSIVFLLQAHKFYGVQDPVAQEYFEAIKSAKSPEEAARIGRKMQRHSNIK